MQRTVYCTILKREAEGLDEAPMPGELGQNIYHHVSAEGWSQLLQWLQMFINENQLTTADPANLKQIEKHLEAYIFSDNHRHNLPAGFHPKD